MKNLKKLNMVVILLLGMLSGCSSANNINEIPEEVTSGEELELVQENVPEDIDEEKEEVGTAGEIKGLEFLEDDLFFAPVEDEPLLENSDEQEEELPTLDVEILTIEEQEVINFEFDDYQSTKGRLAEEDVSVDLTATFNNGAVSFSYDENFFHVVDNESLDHHEVYIQSHDDQVVISILAMPFDTLTDVLDVSPQEEHYSLFEMYGIMMANSILNGTDFTIIEKSEFSVVEFDYTGGLAQGSAIVEAAPSDDFVGLHIWIEIFGTNDKGYSVTSMSTAKIHSDLKDARTDLLKSLQFFLEGG